MHTYLNDLLGFSVRQQGGQSVATASSHVWGIAFKMSAYLLEVIALEALSSAPELNLEGRHLSGRST